jgi:hypothetical protein
MPVLYYPRRLLLDRGVVVLLVEYDDRGRFKTLKRGSGEAGGSLLELAEALRAPVATTYMGKGSFPADHPLASVREAFNAGQKRLRGFAKGKPARAEGSEGLMPTDTMRRSGASQSGSASCCGGLGVM